MAYVYNSRIVESRSAKLLFDLIKNNLTLAERIDNTRNFIRLAGQKEERERERDEGIHENCHCGAKEPDWFK